MSKVNFSKVEKSFEKAMEKRLIEELSELAIIADGIQDPKKVVSSKAVEEIIDRIQKELKKIKEEDEVLFKKLNLSPEVEQRLYISLPNEFLQEDWLHLKELKQRLDELKKELHGTETLNAENNEQIEKERKKHINKRFNVREGWLPLR